ncbi:MAG: 2-vinyl bacteriochlorophyllide hydratase [Pseudomonadota bacterium]
MRATHQRSDRSRPLYTDDQRRIRDRSVWTIVQGVLAPTQFLIFIISLLLVLRFLITGDGYDAAVLSVIAKTIALALIMATGAIWEKEVFGQYLFADSFFWEDVVSMIVVALHAIYVAALLLDIGGARAQMGVALAAYAVYVVNAGQFLWKLRVARLESAPQSAAGAPA